MGLVVTAHVSAHQVFQVSQEALDPRDQQVPRDHPEIMALKDLWALEETRVMKAPVEDEVLQALKGLYQKSLNLDFEQCIRTRSDFQKHLAIKNCDKIFLKIILRLKNC